MNRKIYRKIAKDNKISTREVKQEMQAAINAAYIYPNKEALSIPRKNETPTIDEFIYYSLTQLKKED